jgi:hypothetical protein
MTREGGKDRISYKVKCKRKKEKGTGIATGCALAMTEEDPLC